MSAHPAHSPRVLSRQWVGRLASYRHHKNDEHREALIEEAKTFAGFQLEADLSSSAYWSQASLARRVAVLLFLIDRGAAMRVATRSHVSYEAVADAETWAASQMALAPYLGPTLEMIAAMRNAQARRLTLPE